MSSIMFHNTSLSLNQVSLCQQSSKLRLYTYLKILGPNLKHAPGMTSIGSLPDEVALKIVKLAALTDDGDIDHDFLADVLCKVSVRFRKLATDYSLWKGYVMIGADKNPRKAEFVVQECLNSGTRDFLICGDLIDFFEVLTSPRYARYINPTVRFPNLKLIETCSDLVAWSTDPDNDEKRERESYTSLLQKYA